MSEPILSVLLQCYETDKEDRLLLCWSNQDGRKGTSKVASYMKQVSASLGVIQDGSLKRIIKRFV